MQNGFPTVASDINLNVTVRIKKRLFLERRKKDESGIQRVSRPLEFFLDGEVSHIMRTIRSVVKLCSTFIIMFVSPSFSL